MERPDSLLLQLVLEIVQVGITLCIYRIRSSFESLPDGLFLFDGHGAYMLEFLVQLIKFTDGIFYDLDFGKPLSPDAQFYL